MAGHGSRTAVIYRSLSVLIGYPERLHGADGDRSAHL